MNPGEVCSAVKAMGYHLALRPGGLRLEGDVAPTAEVVALVTGHRVALMAFLEADTKAWALHEASLAAGRLTTFPAYLHHLVDPVLVRACLAELPPPITKTRTAA